ncbi:MAG: hypothetical protein V4598_19345 [Bdellovibrionota bacterium]
MSEKRDLGLLCHKSGESFVFFIESNNGPFIYVIRSGIPVTGFMKIYPGLQEDLFLKMNSDEAHLCQLALKKLSQNL